WCIHATDVNAVVGQRPLFTYLVFSVRSLPLLPPFGSDIPSLGNLAPSSPPLQRALLSPRVPGHPKAASVRQDGAATTRTCGAEGAGSDYKDGRTAPAATRIYSRGNPNYGVLLDVR
ncbi:hypothetical protein EJB05_02911, partial [Eragrostis curvula]